MADTDNKSCSKADIFKMLFDKVNKTNNTCDKYPDLPSIVPKQERIIAIGDIHGDLNVAIECLVIAKVIQKTGNKETKNIMDNYEWIGNKTVVVQVGDMLDDCRVKNDVKNNCSDDGVNEGMDVDVLNFFNDVHVEALKHGGAVYTLLGNHELMNVSGSLSYVSYVSLKGFADYFYELYDRDECPNFNDAEIGKIVREFLFKPGNEYAVKMACTCLSTIIVGSYLFVHAGIIPEFIQKNNITGQNDIIRINNAVKDWLLGKKDKSEVQTIVTTEAYSMFWDRKLGAIAPNQNGDNADCKEYLDPVLDILEIKGMVIGHTPQFFGNQSGINGTCNNKLWRVDAGSSHAFNKFDDHYRESGKMMEGRKPQIIEIINDTTINVITHT